MPGAGFREMFCKQLLQEFADVYMDSLCSKHLIHLIRTVADENSRNILNIYVEEMLKLAGDPAKDIFLDRDLVGKEFSEVWKDAEVGAKCLGTLLNVVGPVRLSGKEVLFVANYSGKQSFLRVLKSLLTTPEAKVEGVELDTTRVQSRKLLMDLTSDVVRTAATAGPAQALLDGLMQQLEALPSDLPAASSGNAFEMFSTVLEKLPGLRKDMRKGASIVLEQLLIQKVMSLAQSILVTKDASLSSQDMQLLLRVLEEVGAKKGSQSSQATQEMHAKLTTFATKHNANMVANDLKHHVQSYMQACQEQQYVEVIEFDAVLLGTLVKKVALPLAADLEKLLCDAVPMFMCRALLQAVVV